MRLRAGIWSYEVTTLTLFETSFSEGKTVFSEGVNSVFRGEMRIPPLEKQKKVSAPCIFLWTTPWT